MKISVLFAIILPCLLAVTQVNAQTVAIGHATAEVVESVSASSLAVTNFSVSNTSDMSYQSLKLGEITVNSGSSVAFNVVIKPATLSRTGGSSFTMEPTANSSLQTDFQSTDGDQTIQLTADANSVQGKVSGLYKGSYSIVFAYN